MSVIRNVLSGGQEGEPGDVVAMLEADHRNVEQLFKAIQAAQGRDRSPLVDRLGTELGLHMAIEESLVYPRVSSFDREMSEEAKAEHELARKVLRDLQRLSPDEPGFDGALEMVRAGIQHHVQEEEQEVLPKLRQQLDEAAMDELTDAVRAAKERGRAPRRSAPAGKGSSRPGRARTSSSRSSSSRSSSASKSPSRKKGAPSKTTARKRSASGASTGSASSSRSASSRSTRGGGNEVTKAELVRQAKRQGVSGYSSMNKAQLERALSR